RNRNLPEYSTQRGFLWRNVVRTKYALPSVHAHIPQYAGARQELAGVHFSSRLGKDVKGPAVREHRLKNHQGVPRTHVHFSNLTPTYYARGHSAPLGCRTQ